ncbi:perlucin-like protein [Saccoglossus kowalevskii]
MFDGCTGQMFYYVCRSINSIHPFSNIVTFVESQVEQLIYFNNIGNIRMNRLVSVILLSSVSPILAQNASQYDTVCNRVPGNTVQYHLFTDEMFWFDAQTFCEDKFGGILARIPNKETDDLIRSHIISSGAGDVIQTGFWIGYNDIRSEGEYEWAGGKILCQDYVNWARKEPNNNTKKRTEGQDCVQLRKKVNFLWDDDYCDYREKGFICETAVCDSFDKCNICSK